MHTRTAIVSALSLGIAGALSAGAYVTSTGSADASAKAEVIPLVVSAAIAPSPVVFGDHATVTVTGTNPNPHGAMKVSGVTLSLVTTGLPATCPAASFALLNPTPPLAVSGLAGGASNVTLATTQVGFVDLGPSVDQTACDAQDIKVHAVVS